MRDAGKVVSELVVSFVMELFPSSVIRVKSAAQAMVKCSLMGLVIDEVSGSDKERTNWWCCTSQFY